MFSGRISLFPLFSPAARYRSAPVLALFLAVTFCPSHALAWVRSGSGSNSGLPCNAYYQSSLAFNSTADTIEFCDGSNWTNLLSTNAADDQIDLGTSAVATNPSVNGDLSSGLFSPAASTVAIATGGVQRMTVNSGGYVGIGTASPSFMLDVFGPATNTGGIRVTNANQYGAAITFNNTSPGGNSYALGSQGNGGWAQGTFSLSNGGGNTLMDVSNTGGVELGGSFGSAAPTSGLVVSGNVGIGSTIPVNALDVNGNADATAFYSNTFRQSSSGAGMVTNGNGNRLLLYSNNNYLAYGDGVKFVLSKAGILSFDAVGAPTSGSQDTGISRYAAGVTAIGNGTQGDYSGTLIGNSVGIGTAVPAEPLEIYSAGSGVLLQLAGSSGTCNHTPGSSSETVSCSSDMRLKSGAIDAPSALPWLSSIRVRDFTWKNTGQKRTGVIAQELQKTHPEMVTYNRRTDEWTVEQPNPWTLVKILQEQQAEIDDLKKQLAAPR